MHLDITMSSKILKKIISYFSYIILGCAISVLAFFVYTLVLRTAFKATALEINDAILTCDDIAISCGDDNPVFVNIATVDYYDKFLFDRYTVVFAAKDIPVSANSIIIYVGEDELSFTSLSDSSEIAIKWKTTKTEKNYIVRSQISYLQLKAYYSNLKRTVN